MTITNTIKNQGKLRMPKLRQWHYLLVFLLVMVILPEDAFATHIIGGKIRYECLGGDNYDVFLTVYRDCYNSSEFFDEPASIGIYDADNNLRYNIHVDLMTHDTLSKDLDDPCLFVPDNVCVDVGYYRETVNLPFREGGYKMIYQRCCRNQTVTNIVDPLETGGTYMVELTEEAMLSCNNSPDFVNPSPIFVCLDKPIQFDNGAIDADGDSLVYSLYTPNAGATITEFRPDPPPPPPFDTVIYTMPYSLTDLMGNPAAPLTIDPSTGMITGTPTVIGQFVIGVQVEEYRNGQLLSVVKRDYQFNVGHCGEYVSSIQIPHAQCDDLTVDFGNQSQDATDYEWYFDYPDHPEITSTEFEPQYTYQDTGTYNIMLIAQPGSVCADTSYAQIFLQDNSLTAAFDVTISDCADSSIVALQDLSSDDVSPPSEWYWELAYGTDTLTSVEQNPYFMVPVGASGTITLTVESFNTCVQTIQHEFTTGGNYPGDFIEDTITICKGAMAVLNTTVVEGYAYHWYPEGAFSDPLDPTPGVSPDTTTVYSVELTGLNGLCQSQKEVTVIVEPLPELDYSYHIGCDGLTVEFTNLSTNASAFLWTFEDVHGQKAYSNEVSPTILFPENGIYSVLLAVDTTALCQDTIVRSLSLPVRVLDAEFSYDYTTCSTDGVTISFSDETTNSLDNTAEWHWTFSGIGDSDIPNPTIDLTEDATFDVELLVVTDEGCRDSITHTLTVEVMDLDNMQDTVQICHFSQEYLNPNPNTAYAYLWSPAVGLDDPTSPNPLASPEHTTIYTAQITNISADTCVITKQVVAFVPPAINIQTTNDLVTCAPTATIEVTGNDIVSTEWTIGGNSTGTDNQLTVDVSGTDTYNVTVTNSYGCRESASVTVAGGPVDISVSGDSQICTNEPVDAAVVNLDANDTLSYQWTPVENFVSGTNTANPTVLNTPGIKSLFVEVENQFGCSAMDTVNVVIVDEDINFDFDFTIECSGTIVDFTNTSSNAFDFSWDFGDTYHPDTDTSTADNPNYAYEHVGTYEVTLGSQYDVACATPVTKTVVIEDTLLYADYSYYYEDCSQNSITVFFTDESQNYQNNTASWEWKLNGVTFSTEPTASYTFDDEDIVQVSLTIVSADGCSATREKILNIDFIEDNIESSVGLCVGDSIGLNPGGNTNYQYQWTPVEGLSDPTAPNPVVSPHTTTTYTAVITNLAADTCQITKEITVVVHDFVPVVQNAVYACYNQHTALNPNAVTAYDYHWSPATGLDDATAPNPTVTITGDATYMVTVSETYGIDVCETVQEVTVGVFDFQPVTPPAALTSCYNQPFELNPGAVESYDYVWSPGTGLDDSSAANPTVTPLSDETYNYTISEIYGDSICQVEGSVAVEVHDFNPVVQSDIFACYEQQTELNPNAVTAYDYQWSPATGLDDATAPNPTVTISDDVTYSVTISETYGDDVCETVETVAVGVFDFQPVTPPNALTSCYNQPFELNPGAVESYDYVWSPGTGLDDSNAANPTVTPLNDETYNYTISEMYGDSICQVEGSVEVVVHEFHPVVQNEVFACSNLETALNPNAVLEYNYQWTPIAGLDDSTAPNPTVTVTHDVTYAVVISENYGDDICQTEAEVAVGVFDFQPVIGGTVYGCRNQPIAINENGVEGYDYLWSPGTGLDNTTGANPVATLSESNSYSVVVSETYGDSTCQVTGNVDVVIYDFQPIVEDSLIACYNVPTALNPDADEAYDYLWSPVTGLDDSTAPNPNATLVEPETYTVTVSEDYESAHCAETFQVFVDVVHEINLNLSATPDTIILNAGQSSQLQSTYYDGFDYEWEPSISLDDGNIYNPVATPEETTTYTLVVSDENGCGASEEVTVFVKDITCGEPFIFVPSAFTPNGDTENDVFRVRGEYLTSLYLAIYDRWGQKVYETNDVKGEWDGTFKNRPLTPDVYGYYLKARCLNGEEFFKKGNVTLLK